MEPLWDSDPTDSHWGRRTVPTPAGVKLTCAGTDGLYATAGRTVVRARPGAAPTELGRLPAPPAGRDRLRYHLKLTAPLSSSVAALVGAVASANVWPVSEQSLLASVGDRLLHSSDGGATWTRVLRLPPSSGPMCVLPPGVSVDGTTVSLGEYPLADDATPRVRRSDDGGRSWSTVLELPAVRHVHGLHRDPVSDRLWITTGDTDAESRIGWLHDGTVECIGTGTQRWRAVSLVFTPDAVFWGIDSAYARPAILRLDRSEIGTADPTPTPVHDPPGPVYYGTTFEVDGTRWIAFSTAIEPSADSTAPVENPPNYSRRAAVVAASDRTDYRRWYRLAAYERRRVFGDAPLVASFVPRTAAYVFLAAKDGTGLFVNPFNTERHHGTIHHYTPAYFAALSADSGGTPPSSSGVRWR